MDTLISITQKIIGKIPAVFNNILGWMLALISGYITWLADAKGAIMLILISIFWDMGWGVAAAVKQKNFVLSHLLRETFWKIIVYVGSLSIILFAERTIGSSFNPTVKIIAVIGATVELFSSAGNILIIKPNFHFVRLFSKYLIGEIAQKMKKTEQEVQQMLNNEQN
ncbi:MAG: hypothetical protein II202_01315 [Bacteroidales bacterium]|nr:hypothetical protein [Bacteroidales bacterium]MBQ5593245.1 hypothetical protein [Bacteroidales bacterium]